MTGPRPSRPWFRAATGALALAGVLFAGAASAQDETPASAAVDIDQPDLGYFARDGRAALLRDHLVRSPQWRVTLEDGDLVAFRRELVDGRWRAGRAGFLGDDDPRARVQRPAFRFAPEPSAGDDPVARAKPDQGRVELPVRRRDGALRSRLAVGRPGLWFEFVEESAYADRTLTRETLLWLKSYLASLRAEESAIRERGYAPSAVPPSADSASSRSMNVRDGPREGVYEVRAWLNPAEAGTAELRVVDAGSGEALPADDGAGKVEERVGWSRTGSELFLFNAPVAIHTGGDESREARFELWFEPDAKGGEPRRLAQMARVVRGGR